MRRVLSATAVVATATAVGAGGTWALAREDTAQNRAHSLAQDVISGSPSSADVPDAAVTALPGLEPASGEPTLPGLAQAAPTSGTAGRVAGPFDDRFDLTRLRFDGRQVQGEVDITSDVSDLLELQVLAGWYDAHGRLLGTARFVHHGEHAGGSHVDPRGGVARPDETWPFTMRVPARLGGRVASASVGVPILVNE